MSPHPHPRDLTWTGWRSYRGTMSRQKQFEYRISKNKNVIASGQRPRGDPQLVLNCLALAFILILIPFPLSAKVPDLPTITPANFTMELARVTSTYEHIIQNNPKSLIRKFKKAHGAHHYRFSATETQLKNDYQKIVKQRNMLDPINQLKQSMKDMYLEHYSVTSDQLNAMDYEATLLAVGLFKEIARLQKKYDSFLLPVIHNALLAVHAKKRGACKHWAEDLLIYLKPLKRRFFDVAWGEAYPGK